MESTHTRPSPGGVFLPDGSLNRAAFDPLCVAALDLAAEWTAQTRWQEIRSPHLLLGVLQRPGNLLADELRRAGKSPARVAGLFVRHFRRKGPDVPKPPLAEKSFSPNARQILAQAHALAFGQAPPRIRETDIVEVILSGDNAVTQALAAIGIDPASLFAHDNVTG
ncbi:MAG TPA: Clp protease N-terminal domain-containing protein [Gemmataceae bacterium]